MKFTNKEIGYAKASLKMMIVKHLMKIDERYIENLKSPCIGCEKIDNCNNRIYQLDECNSLNEYNKSYRLNYKLLHEFSKTAIKIIKKNKDIIDLKLIIFKIKNHETSKQ